MSRSALLRLALVAALVLSGCADDNTDDQPPDGQPSPTTSPAAPTEPTPSTPSDVPTVPALHPAVDDYPEALVTLAGADDGVQIAVKLADTADRRAHGLMEVEDLPAGTGMLFVFDEERTGGFWMKNTLVPLDIAYAAADGEIVAILAMEPCTAEPCEVYEPDAAYQSALEVPQGWFDRVGVAVGDTLSWEPLASTG